MERVINPSKYGYYTIKKYALKSDNPIKLTYFKRSVREGGWEKARNVKITEFQEPLYHDGGEPIYFGIRPQDRIIEFENELVERYSYDHKLDQSLIRSKSRLFEYALCNPFEYFVTLTLNKDLHDRYDLSLFKKKLGKFLDNYKRRKASDIQYVLVPEFHKDGAVHMHGLVSGIPDTDMVINENGFIDWPDYSKRFGFFSCDKIRDYERCAKYITKYITKELRSMPKGSQVILCSKRLKKAEILDKGYNVNYNIDNADYENDYVKVNWFSE